MLFYRVQTAAANGDDEDSIRDEVLAFARRDPRAFKQAKRLADDDAKSLQGYWSDRCKRVMDAVAEDRPVRPASADMADTYRREEWLGGLEPSEALAALCQESDELRALDAAASATAPFPPDASHRDTLRPFLRWTRAIGKVVGPKSGAEDALLRTMTAEQKVSAEIMTRLGLWDTPASADGARESPQPSPTTPGPSPTTPGSSPASNSDQ